MHETMQRCSNAAAAAGYLPRRLKRLKNACADTVLGPSTNGETDTLLDADDPDAETIVRDPLDSDAADRDDDSDAVDGDTVNGDAFEDALEADELDADADDDNDGSAAAGDAGDGGDAAAA